MRIENPIYDKVAKIGLSALAIAPWAGVTALTLALTPETQKLIQSLLSPNEIGLMAFSLITASLGANFLIEKTTLPKQGVNANPVTTAAHILFENLANKLSKRSKSTNSFPERVLRSPSTAVFLSTIVGICTYPPYLNALRSAIANDNSDIYRFSMLITGAPLNTLYVFLSNNAISMVPLTKVKDCLGKVKRKYHQKLRTTFKEN